MPDFGYSRGSFLLQTKLNENRKIKKIDESLRSCTMVESTTIVIDG